MIEEQIIKELPEAMQEWREQMKNIVASVLWLSIGIAIAYHSLGWYFIYIFVSWAVCTIIEAKKTTGGKGVNRPVDKGSNPFK